MCCISEVEQVAVSLFMLINEFDEQPIGWTGFC